MNPSTSLISPAQALEQILGQAQALAPQCLPLSESLGLVLAKPLEARSDMPRLDVSAVDGYAVTAEGLLKDSPLPLGPAIAAGDAVAQLEKGQARPIYTGAPLPRGADRIIPNELAQTGQGSVRFSYLTQPGANVRRQGEELRLGTVGLEKGVPLDPAAIGLAAALGHGQVWVHPRPRIRVFITGDELRPAGTELSAGQIWDSNGPLTQAWLASHGIQVHPQHLPDDLDEVASALAETLQSAQVLITCGGASVGDKDFLRPALKALGVKTLFWRVAQKPGKPLFFGKFKKTLIFGLPGNPAAAAFCLSHYVAPALEAMQGLKPKPALSAQTEQALAGDGSKTIFLKVKVQWREGRAWVGKLAHQGSHMLSSLALADGWLEVPPGGLQEGQSALVWSL